MPLNGSHIQDRKLQERTSGAAFPTTRLRRNRMQAWSRRLVAENTLTPADLIWPVFIHEGENNKLAIPSMPGVFRHSIDLLIDAVGEAKGLGIPMIALFPALDESLKDADGTLSHDPNNLVCRAVRALKEAHPDIGVMCDVALDPFTDHGHDGVIRNGKVDNDASVEILVKQSLAQARAGCDVIAPSDMMDGRIGAVRQALDADGLSDVQIMAYAAKYSSGFYGPFRDAVGAGAKVSGGGKDTYQLSPSNGDEAIREVALDIAEGADMVMVKPGMPYLDILQRVKQEFHMPTFSYQVSGEYAMIHAAAERGWMDLDRAMMESLIGFKRAGADGILTYFAIDAAKKI